MPLLNCLSVVVCSDCFNRRRPAGMESQLKSAGKGGPDMLDVHSTSTVGGGVGDTFGEDAASEEMTLTPWTRMVARYSTSIFKSPFLPCEPCRYTCILFRFSICLLLAT